MVQRVHELYRLVFSRLQTCLNILLQCRDHSLSFEPNSLLGWEAFRLLSRGVCLCYISTATFVVGVQRGSSEHPTPHRSLERGAHHSASKSPVNGVVGLVFACHLGVASSILGHSIEGSEMCISGDRSSLSTWFGSHVKLLVPLLNDHWFHAM